MRKAFRHWDKPTPDVKRALEKALPLMLFCPKNERKRKAPQTYERYVLKRHKLSEKDLMKEPLTLKHTQELIPRSEPKKLPK